MLIGISLFVLIFSVMIHEVSHGAAAYLCGDDTAQKEGRLTLNPVRHIEVMGSIVLPLLLMVMQAPVLFGWAKPIPIDPGKMHSPRKDIVLVSFAGPLSNIVLIAIGFLGLKWVVGQVDINLFHTYLGLSSDVKSHILLRSRAGMPYVMIECFIQLILINSTLAVFNLIPIPPLDGSRIYIPFLTPSIEPFYRWLEKYGVAVLFLLLYFRVFDPIFNAIFFLMAQLIEGIV